MPHIRKLLFSLLIALVVTISFSFLASNFLILNSYPNVLSDQVKKTLPPQSKTVDIIARVSGFLVEYLTGWTSPYAEVLLSSLNFSRKTLADKDGFFAFYNVPVPENTGELCLISQDVNQYISSLVCIPAPPADKSIQIQDLLLSPSLSLESDSITSGKTAKASGMTFPNTEVDVYLFTEPQFSIWAKITKIFPTIKLPKLSIVQSSKCKVQSCSAKLKVLGYPVNLKLLTVNFNFELLTLNFKLIKSAYALGLPIYRVKSNENGYFEFSLPASAPSDNRVFAVSYLSSLGDLGNLRDFRSPKSNTLAFKVIGIVELFNKFLQNFFHQARSFFASLKDNSLKIIILEILVLTGLIVFILLKTISKDNQNTSNNTKSLKEEK